MAELPGAKASGSGDSRVARPARLPWLRTFLTILVVIVLPAVFGYVWFSAVQTEAFERRDRQVLESMAGQLKSELATTETILSFAPTAVRPLPGARCDARSMRDSVAEDRKRVTSYLAVSGRLELAPESFPKRVPCKTPAEPFAGCRLALSLESTGGAKRLEIRVVPATTGPSCAFAGLRASQKLEDAAGFDRLRGEFDTVLVLTPDQGVIPGPGASQAATLRPEFLDASNRPLSVATLFGRGPGGAAPRGEGAPDGSSAGGPASAALAAADEAALPLRRWLGTSFAHLPRTRLLGAEYLTFAVPVKLQLARGAAGNEIDLLLLGLVSEERFRAEAFALGPTAVSVLATGVVAVLLSLPYLKIRFMGRRERLRRSDMALLAASIYLAAVLGTATILHWGARSALRREMDARIVEIAHRVQHDVADEVDAAIVQLRQSQSWPAGTAADPRHEHTQIMAYPLGRLAYPFFESIFVTDASGMQTGVWTRRTSRIPLLALGSRQYFEVAKQTPQSAMDYVFDSVDGKPTGRETAVFAAPIERARPGATPRLGFDVPVANRDGIIALTTILNSLSEAVLPAPYRLVVVDADGHALFRSDGRRNRREDFFADLGMARPALGFAKACDGVPQTVRLLGRLQRMVLCSLDALPVAGSGQRPATLVVLYDFQIVEALALDLFATVLFWGTIVGLGCAAALVVCRVVDRAAFDAFWPTARRSRLYLVCTGALLAVLVVMIRTEWRSATAGYALVAIPAGVLLVLPLAARLLARIPGVAETSPDAPVRPFDRRMHPYAFIVFELALLCVIAVAPAVVVFEDALEAQSVGRRSRSQQEFGQALASRIDEWERELLPVDERPWSVAASDCVDPPAQDLAAQRACLFPKRSVVSAANLAQMNRFRRKTVAQDFVHAFVPRGSTVERTAYLAREHPLCNEPPWGIYPTRDQCRGRALQTVESVPRSECSAFFLLDRSAAPRRFFSLVAQSCLPAGLDVLLPIRRESLAADASSASVSVPDSSPELAWPAIGIASALLVGAFGWLFASIARHILGLDFEGDGVLDRSADVRPTIAALATERPALGEVVRIEPPSPPMRWILIQPPAELRREIDRLPGVWPLDLLRVELVDKRIVEKPDASEAVVVVDGLAVRLDDEVWRRAIERFLAGLRCRAVFVVSPVDPLLHLESVAECAEGSVGAAAKADLPIWAELLRSFERARFAARSEREARALLASDCSVAADGNDRWRLERLRRFVAEETRWNDELFEIGRALVARSDFAELDRSRIEEHLLDAAAPVYQSLWSHCTEEERLLLHQIAREGLANPRQSGVLLRLRRHHLVRANPRFRVMSQTFRRFVLEAVPPEEVTRWEQPHGESTAMRIRGPLLVLAGVAGVLLLLTQQTLVTSTLGLAASAVGTVGALQAVLARAQAARGVLPS